MDFIASGSSTALVAAALLLLTLLAVRRRSRNASQQGPREALDTVQAWPPEPARVMTTHERQAFELLKRALPGYMVLAQDKVNCKNMRCRRPFEVSGTKTLAFLTD